MLSCAASWQPEMMSWLSFISRFSISASSGSRSLCRRSGMLATRWLAAKVISPERASPSAKSAAVGAVRFDVFTLDFRSEASGAVGALLSQQAEMVNDAVAGVQRLYSRGA